MRRGNQNRIKHGRGIITDSIGAVMNSYFTKQEFPGEHHGVVSSDDKINYGKTYQYLGPGTHVKERIARGDKGLNDLDRSAMKHDVAYMNALNKYKQDNDKNNFNNSIWSSDDEFINEARNSKDDKKMGKIAANLMSMKKTAEKSHILPTGIFSGAGKSNKKRSVSPSESINSNMSNRVYTKESNPAKKLIEETIKRDIINTEQRHVPRERGRTRRKSQSRSRSRSRSLSSNSNVSQRGGLGPIAAVLIPLLFSAGPEIIKGIYNYVKGGDQDKKGSGRRGKRGKGIEEKRDELIKHFYNL